jgi:hypothetical protein
MNKARQEELWEERYYIKVKELEEANNTSRRLSLRNIQLEKAAAYYNRLQVHIKENENLLAAWKEFICIYAMTHDLSELGPMGEYEMEQYLRD